MCLKFCILCIHQHLYSPYARTYLTASQMQNKIRYREIVQIVDLYLNKCNITVSYITWWASSINMNEY
jgi:phosphohistidine phosphatase SixA